MKKALILGILGLAAAATQSFGQGHTEFDNYAATPYMPVMYNGSGVTSASINVQLFYFLGTATSVSQMTAGPTTTINPILVDSTGAANHGYFQAGAYDVPGYVSGPCSFAVEVWNTAANNGAGTGYSSFAAAQAGTGGQWGVSSIWTESSLPTGLSAPAYWSALPGPNGAPLMNLTVNPVPEPSILALSGIGAAALMLIRRKK